MASVALRDASDAEIAAIFRARAEHVVGTINGIAVVYARLQTIDDRRWAMLNVLSPVPRSSAVALFIRLRRWLEQECRPVYVLRESEASGRLLELLGFYPTGEFSVGKEVWRWKPQQ